MWHALPLACPPRAHRPVLWTPGSLGAAWWAMGEPLLMTAAAKPGLDRGDRYERLQADLVATRKRAHALEARVKEADRILAKRFPGVGLQALMARAEKAEAERDAALERAKVLQLVLDNVAVLTVGGKPR